MVRELLEDILTISFYDERSGIYFIAYNVVKLVVLALLGKNRIRDMFEAHKAEFAESSLSVDDLSKDLLALGPFKTSIGIFV